MVRYYSDDGVFDGPVQKVWRLIEAHGERLAEIHPNVVSHKGIPQADGSTRLDVVTRMPDGTKVGHTWRILFRPPYSQIIEILDGPLKGSWMTITYVPEGNRTRAVTVSEYRVQGVTDESTLQKMAQEYFDGAYDEDARFLKML
ncbi:MAG TPA: hypothetical protein VM681_04035 [Candidatus Thermoplasmatota archaeon]|nr:hypothetical protein [Candidatus Thermoplasmatota archaeon]